MLSFSHQNVPPVFYVPRRLQRRRLVSWLPIEPDRVGADAGPTEGPLFILKETGKLSTSGAKAGIYLETSILGNCIFLVHELGCSLEALVNCFLGNCCFHRCQTLQELAYTKQSDPVLDGSEHMSIGCVLRVAIFHDR